MAKAQRRAWWSASPPGFGAADCEAARPSAAFDARCRLGAAASCFVPAELGCSRLTRRAPHYIRWRRALGGAISLIVRCQGGLLCRFNPRRTQQAPAGLVFLFTSARSRTPPRRAGSPQNYGAKILRRPRSCTRGARLRGPRQFRLGVRRMSGGCFKAQSTGGGRTPCGATDKQMPAPAGAARYKPSTRPGRSPPADGGRTTRPAMRSVTATRRRRDRVTDRGRQAPGTPALGHWCGRSYAFAWDVGGRPGYRSAHP